MTCHQKEGWLPPHVQTPKSDRRETPSRQGAQLEPELREPPVVPPLRFTQVMGFGLHMLDPVILRDPLAHLFLG